MVKTNAIKRFEKYGVIDPNEAGQIAEYLAEQGDEAEHDNENT